MNPTIPVSDWQKEELARRDANLRENPDSGLAWEEVKGRVRRRLEEALRRAGESGKAKDEKGE